MPILKHRLELQGISHVVSLVSFSDVKAFEENNFTGFTPKRMVWNPCQKSLVYAGHLLFDGHLLFRGHMVFEC